MNEKCVCVQFSREEFLPYLFHEEVLFMKPCITSDMYTYVYTYTILYTIFYSIYIDSSRNYVQYVHTYVYTRKVS